MLRRNRIVSLTACLSFAAGRALAGGSGENVVIIADPLNPESMYAANYYKQARNLPDVNILCFHPGASDYHAFVEFNIAALRALVAERGIAGQADYVLLMPGAPFYINAPDLVTDGCFPVNRFSISGAYTTAFITADVLAGVSSTYGNRYSRNTFTPMPFDSEIAWLSGSASDDPNAKRYYLGAMLGYTGALGNTLEEILANVDRSVDADFSRPPGTFYFMKTTDDARSGPRHNTFPGVVSEIIDLGGAAVMEERWLPQNRFDCLSILTGMADPDIQGGNFTIIPGAYCDHLTSYAATFDTASQTKVSEWIKKGATASWGTVEEPCNYPGKFTHARSQVYYFLGASMGESIFRAVGFTPFQGLLYGDPMCRPFDYLVGVAVGDPPENPVAGVVEITASGSTGKPFHLVLDFDVAVDNRRVAAGFAMPLMFDTTALADGWHDLRVHGYDTSDVRSMGVWQGELIVRNLGRSAKIEGTTLSGDHSTHFAFDASAATGGLRGAPLEIRLVQGGRVLAAAPGCEATLEVTGLQLGAGPSRVQAEALYADGMRVRSAPLGVVVEYADGTPSGAAPNVFISTSWIGDATEAFVELPYTHDNAGDKPGFQIVDAPAQATIVPGPAGPYVLLNPDPDASGYDVMTYRVANGAGQSPLGRVVLVYDRAPADVNGDRSLDIDDLHHINQNPADVNLDGLADASDIGLLERILRCGELRDMAPER